MLIGSVDQLPLLRYAQCYIVFSSKNFREVYNIIYISIILCFGWVPIRKCLLVVSLLK